MGTTIVLTLAEDYPEAETHLEKWARGVIAFRQRRANQFGSDLFGGNGWDLLLHLAIAPPTGLTRSELAEKIKRSDDGTRRWLNVLVDRGLVEESLDLRYRLSASGLEDLNATLS
jgi:MarR family